MYLLSPTHPVRTLRDLLACTLSSSLLHFFSNLLSCTLSNLLSCTLSNSLSRTHCFAHCLTVWIPAFFFVPSYPSCLLYCTGFISFLSSCYISHFSSSLPLSPSFLTIGCITPTVRSATCSPRHCILLHSTHVIVYKALNQSAFSNKIRGIAVFCW